jgi:hypothetical protein
MCRNIGQGEAQHRKYRVRQANFLFYMEYIFYIYNLSQQGLVLILQMNSFGVTGTE